MQWFAFRAGSDEDALAARLGLAPWRSVVQMRRPMPLDEKPTWPEGVEVRSFRPGEDDDEWVRVNRRAFADHPEQGAVEVAGLRALMQEEWFDPQGFLVAEDAEGMAGFCWTKIPDGAHGEIYAIGVDPDRQGRGLGRALVVAGLAHIAGTGVPEATLYVEADNDPARSLYRDLGFVTDHADRAYAADT